MAFPPPHLEIKYEILEKIHQGGMGEIYTARHLLLDEIRVIKVVRVDKQNDHDFQARFLREAQASVRLRHPNIAQVHDFSLDEQGAGYLEMEHIEGANLLQLVEKHGALPPPLVLEIAFQSLGALDCLHQEGYVHRDISPDNLMIALGHRSEPIVKIIDLGLAKAARASRKLTSAGVFLGKLDYASPEHLVGIEGKTRVESRSDLYSLGVVLYKMFTGKLPAGHLSHPPPDFAETDPEGRVPAELRKLVLQSLAKRVEDRPRSAHELRLAFERARIGVGEIVLKEIPRLIAEARGSGALSDVTTEFRVSVERLVPRLQALLEARSPDDLESLLDKLPAPVSEDPRVDGYRADLADLRSQEKHLEDARRLLDRGDYQAAQEALEAARNFSFPSARLEALEEEARDARRAHATELLGAMEDLLGSRAWSEGRKVLASVSEVDREHPELGPWADRLERRHLAAERAESLAALRRHLNAMELGEARRTFEKARALGVPDSSLQILERELARKERRQKVLGHLETLSRRFEQQDWVAVRESLQSAERLGACLPEVAEWRRRIAREQERERRELARKKAIDQVRALLQQGLLEAMRRAIRQAADLGVEPGELRELEVKLEEQLSRRARAARELQTITASIRCGDWGRVARTIESVEDLDPTHPVLPTWKVRFVKARKHQRIAAKKEVVFARDLEKIRDLYRRGWAFVAFLTILRSRVRCGDREALRDLASPLRRDLIRWGIRRLRSDLIRWGNRCLGFVGAAAVVVSVLWLVPEIVRRPATQIPGFVDLPSTGTVLAPFPLSAFTQLSPSPSSFGRDPAAEAPHRPEPSDRTAVEPSTVERPEPSRLETDPPPATVGEAPPEEIAEESVAAAPDTGDVPPAPEPSDRTAVEPSTVAAPEPSGLETGPPPVTVGEAPPEETGEESVAVAPNTVDTPPAPEPSDRTAVEPSTVATPEPSGLETVKPPTVATPEPSRLETGPPPVTVGEASLEETGEESVAVAPDTGNAPPEPSDRTAVEPPTVAAPEPSRLEIGPPPAIVDEAPPEETAEESVAAAPDTGDAPPAPEPSDRTAVEPSTVATPEPSRLETGPPPATVGEAPLEKTGEESVAVAPNTVDTPPSPLQEAEPTSLAEAELRKHGLDPDSRQALEQAIDAGDPAIVVLFATPTNAWLLPPSAAKVDRKIGNLLIEAARNSDTSLVRKLATRAVLKGKTRDAAEIVLDAMRSGNTDMLEALATISFKFNQSTTNTAKRLLHQERDRGINDPFVQASKRILRLSDSELEELLKASEEDLENMLSPSRPILGH